MLLAHRVILGVRRVGKTTRGPKKAITPELLRLLLRSSLFSRLTHSGSALAAMSLLAFFAMLSRSEYLCDGMFNPESDLTVGDIVFEYATDGSPVRVIVTIKGGKTDQYSFGTEVAIGLGFDGLCGVSALHFYMSTWRKGAALSEPAFTSSPGVTASYSFIAEGLRSALLEVRVDPSSYASHSLRSGGATTATAEGAPEYLIKLQGRWASCVFLRYVRKDKRTMSAMAGQMSAAHSPTGPRSGPS
jgi:hypothetical protein